MKFFRKLRQRMLSENKVSRYLLYAVGEIVLVLIGILLALEINSSRQTKNDNETIGLHVKALLDEARTNTDMLQEIINFTEEDLNNCRDLIKLYTAGDFSNPDMESKFYVLYATLDFAPGTSSFENLKNSSLYAKIDNFAVKKSLAEAYKTFERINLALEIDRVPKEAFYTNYVLPKGFLLNSQTRSTSFFENRYFGNMTQTIIQTNSNIKDKIEISLNSFKELDTILREYYATLGIGALQNRTNFQEYYERGNSLKEILTIVKTQDPNNPQLIISENVVNAYGYALLNLKRNREALEVFELNMKLYPNSANTYDSYGEGLLSVGDTLNAIKYYKKALEVDRELKTAIEMLKVIENDQK